MTLLGGKKLSPFLAKLTSSCTDILAQNDAVGKNQPTPAFLFGSKLSPSCHKKTSKESDHTETTTMRILRPLSISPENVSISF